MPLPGNLIALAILALLPAVAFGLSPAEEAIYAELVAKQEAALKDLGALTSFQGRFAVVMIEGEISDYPRDFAFYEALLRQGKHAWPTAEKPAWVRVANLTQAGDRHQAVVEIGETALGPGRTDLTVFDGNTSLRMDSLGNTAHVAEARVDVEASAMNSPLTALHGPIGHRESAIVLADIRFSFLRDRKGDMTRLARESDAAGEFYVVEFELGNVDRLTGLLKPGTGASFADSFRSLNVRYDPEGRLAEYRASMTDLNLSYRYRLMDYRELDGVAFPGLIEVQIERPPEKPVSGTTLIVTDLDHARLNQPIPASRFEVRMPPGASLHDVTRSLSAEPDRPVQNMTQLLGDSAITTEPDPATEKPATQPAPPPPAAPEAAAVPATPIFRPEKPAGVGWWWWVMGELATLLLVFLWTRKRRLHQRER